jgi:alkylated DNA repair dioxygenase AlkB
MGAGQRSAVACLPRQRSLFGGGVPAIPRSMNPQRIELGGNSWLDYQPRWLVGDDTLFDLLLASSAWHRHERPMYDRIVEVPRLTTHVELDAPGASGAHGLLASMSRSLSGHYGRALSSASLSLYRTGRDSVAPHGDKLGPLIDDTVLAIVSLGGPRRMLITRNRADSSHAPSTVDPARLAFNLGGGDLLVMGGSCQRTHLHGIPKVAEANPRMSIVFRERLPDSQIGSEFG